MNRREEALFERQLKGWIPEMPPNPPHEKTGEEDGPSIVDLMESFLGSVGYLKAGLARLGFAEEESQTQLIQTFFEYGG